MNNKRLSRFTPAFILHSVLVITLLVSSNLAKANVETSYSTNNSWVYSYNPVNIPRSPQQDLEMLALTLYHEGRSESKDGLWAIANVIENRVDSEYYPDTIAKVIKQPAQFSFWKDMQDLRMKEYKSRLTAYRIASKVILGNTKSVVGKADHYYAQSKVTPYWLSSMRVIKRIDNHTFLKR